MLWKRADPQRDHSHAPPGTMLSPTVRQEATPPKKKARRSSRQAEGSSPSHYGPVACTSAAAALVQAYLAPDSSSTAAGGAAQSNGGSGGAKGGSSSTNGGSRNNHGSNSTSTLRSTSSGSCSLNMSESTFDPVKRRFGGKSKPVMFANSCSTAPCSAASPSSNSGSGSKGARLSFAQGTKIVATTEAMHMTLHCRCVFVLLCEQALLDTSSSSAGDTSSSSAAAAAAAAATIAAARQSSSSTERIDTAHLVTLSPDDLFCALSLDSFPLAAAGDRISGRIGGHDHHQQQQQATSVAADTCPRAFEVVDGPAIIHRPAAQQGEPWRGLEIFRPARAGGAWRGHRVSLQVGSRPEADDIGLRSIFGGVDAGPQSGTGLRLDLSVQGGNAAGDIGGDADLMGATPPLSQESAAAACSKKRSPDGALSNRLVVCSSSASSAIVRRDVTAGLTRYGWSSKLVKRPRECGGIGENVVALPASAEGGKVEDAPPPAALMRPLLRWMSLSEDKEGNASLSPWRGLPLESQTAATCVCRAPAVDSGVVSLDGEEGGLTLRPLQSTIYVGVVASGGRRAVEASNEASGSAWARGSGGALLELQGGALSGCRLLPAPPAAVMTAAVDDAQGVLVVLLADQAKTALLLARDGSEFPTVEEHRGIGAAFTGDFLGNGREQVALLCSPPTGGGGGSGGGGASKAGKRGAGAATAMVATATARARVGGWEQLPLKTLVKKALVADGSFVSYGGRGDGARAAPSEAASSGSGTAGANSTADVAQNLSSGASQGSSSTGKKRQRSGEAGEDIVGGNTGGSGAENTPMAAARRAKDTIFEGSEDSHRLSRLSKVVGVLRRRVKAEEMRLLRLRQVRRGKAAALEAAKHALAASVGTGLPRFVAGSEAGARGGGGDRLAGADQFKSSSSYSRIFADGLVTLGGGVSTTFTLAGDAPVAETLLPPAPLACTVSRARLHAPSRALCLDVHVRNPSLPAAGRAAEATAIAAGLSATAVDVSLTVVSPSGRLATRSAVCPRLRPGESATIRACVDIPLGLLANGGARGGAAGAVPCARGSASLFASCTYTLRDDDLPTIGTRESGALPQSRSIIFSRIRVSPQDMLGMGGALTSTTQAPAETKTPRGPYNPSAATGGGWKQGAASIGSSNNHGSSNGAEGSSSSNHGSNNDAEGNRSNCTGNAFRGEKHLGLFDVGTPIDLLLYSHPATAASLTALPQAVRSLSDVAALPEPWAGGAAVRVDSCSERAAACTLRAGDSGSAPAVVLAVAAGALPDGTRASADHASEKGRALVAAAAAALRDEIAALEVIARERGRLSGGAGGGGSGGGGGGGGGEQAMGGLEAALERYRATQMRSDVLAARLAGRLVAAGGGPRDGAV